MKNCTPNYIVYSGDEKLHRTILENKTNIHAADTYANCIIDIRTLKYFELSK